MANARICFAGGHTIVTVVLFLVFFLIFQLERGQWKGDIINVCKTELRKRKHVDQQHEEASRVEGRKQGKKTVRKSHIKILWLAAIQISID